MIIYFVVHKIMKLARATLAYRVCMAYFPLSLSKPSNDAPLVLSNCHYIWPRAMYHGVSMSSGHKKARQEKIRLKYNWPPQWTAVRHHDLRFADM